MPRADVQTQALGSLSTKDCGDTRCDTLPRDSPSSDSPSCHGRLAWPWPCCDPAPPTLSSTHVTLPADVAGPLQRPRTRLRGHALHSRASKYAYRSVQPCFSSSTGFPAHSSATSKEFNCGWMRLMARVMASAVVSSSPLLSPSEDAAPTPAPWPAKSS